MVYLVKYQLHSAVRCLDLLFDYPFPIQGKASKHAGNIEKPLDTHLARQPAKGGIYVRFQRKGSPEAVFYTVPMLSL